jgi:trehalose 6-phosphate phosphatase
MEQLGVEALDRLSQMRHTLVAIVSGRGLGSLRAAMNDRDDRLSRCVLVGSHGAEWSSGPLPDLRQKGEQIDHMLRAVHALAAAHAGAFVERKPLGVALHVRGVPDTDEQLRVLAIGQRLLMEAGEVRIRRGSLVVEGSVAHVGKDDAVRALRAMRGQGWPDRAKCSVVALGDDVTDEDAFQVLDEEDLGIKVGEGPTLARSRVGSAPRACEALWALALLREAYLSEEHGKTIEATGT